MVREDLVQASLSFSLDEAGGSGNFAASLGLYSLIKTCGSSLDLRRARQQG
jgi:hypothetical protein